MNSESGYEYSTPTPSRQHRWPALIAILLLSLITNIGLLAYNVPRPPKHEPSKYADLQASLSIPFEWATEYANPNLTESGPLWDAIYFDIGMVALWYTWTDFKDLPRAQVFPWDHDQGLYVINGYHALHCLETGEYELTWGPWHAPGWLGIANNVVSCGYLITIWLFGFFPPAIPVVPSTMNYSSLVFGATVLYSVLYYFIWGKRQYNGPIVEIVI